MNFLLLVIRLQFIFIFYLLDFFQIYFPEKCKERIKIFGLDDSFNVSHSIQSEKFDLRLFCVSDTNEKIGKKSSLMYP